MSRAQSSRRGAGVRGGVHEGKDRRAKEESGGGVTGRDGCDPHALAGRPGAPARRRRPPGANYGRRPGGGAPGPLVSSRAEAEAGFPLPSSRFRQAEEDHRCSERVSNLFQPAPRRISRGCESRKRCQDRSRESFQGGRLPPVACQPRPADGCRPHRCWRFR